MASLQRARRVTFYSRELVLWALLDWSTARRHLMHVETARLIYEEFVLRMAAVVRG